MTIRSKAGRGDAGSQNDLGLMYYTGRGVSQNDQEAAKWFRLAAEQGNTNAQFFLGIMYARGKGVPQNDQEAVKWVSLATNREVNSTLCLLGFMFAKGEGIPHDDQEAVKWYRLAAEQGDANAQCILGLMYGVGRGVPQDDQEAVKWHRLAAEQGDATSQCNLGFRYDKGRGVPQDDQEAVKWYRLAAEQGDATSQCNLGFMYDKGRGVPQDDHEAAKWYLLAAVEGNAEARVSLGSMYVKGRGVPQDDQEAVKWYRLAAEQGDVLAQWCLGTMCETGQGLPQDDEEAVKRCRFAAKQGDALAQRALEKLYNEGRNVPQEDQEYYDPDSISFVLNEKSSLIDLNNERVSLLKSISDIIKDYRCGEIDKPTPDHVDRWINQFDQQFQAQILYETNYVLKRTYFSEERIAKFFTDQLDCVELHGKKQHEFWLGSHILNIQKNGQSQKEIRDLFGKVLKSKFGFELDDCGSDGGAYFYLDDALFSGSRIKADLSSWIMEEAPKKANVYILTVVSHQGGEWWLGRELAEINQLAGKQLVFHFRNAVCYENRKYYRDKAEVLWPTEIPDDPLLQDYLADQKYPFENRSPSVKFQNAIFSTENGRQLLEKEFLLAGVRIRSFSHDPSESLRPLGFGAFGLGFGSMVVTYRNCPNNTPLALWWGDPNAPSHHPFSKWYPLLPRKTYENKQIRRKVDLGEYLK